MRAAPAKWSWLSSAHHTITFHGMSSESKAHLGSVGLLPGRASQVHRQQPHTKLGTGVDSNFDLGQPVSRPLRPLHTKTHHASVAEATLLLLSAARAEASCSGEFEVPIFG